MPPPVDCGVSILLLSNSRLSFVPKTVLKIEETARNFLTKNKNSNQKYNEIKASPISSCHIPSKLWLDMYTFVSKVDPWSHSKIYLPHTPFLLWPLPLSVIRYELNAVTPWVWLHTHSRRRSRFQHQREQIISIPFPCRLNTCSSNEERLAVNSRYINGSHNQGQFFSQPEIHELGLSRRRYHY